VSGSLFWQLFYHGLPVTVNETGRIDRYSMYTPREQWQSRPKLLDVNWLFSHYRYNQITMDITCSKCGTEYSLDDTLISKSGTTVRCMNCSQVFKVFREQDAEPDQWILRQAHGPIRTFNKLSMIQKWIADGKVSENDLISRKNGPWKKIGDIAELKALFTSAPASRKGAGAAAKHRPAGKNSPPETENRDKTQPQGSFSSSKPAHPQRISERPTLPPPSISGRDADKTSETPTPLATPKKPGIPMYNDLNEMTFDSAVTQLRARSSIQAPTIRPKKPVASAPAVRPKERTTGAPPVRPKEPAAARRPKKTVAGIPTAHPKKPAAGIPTARPKKPEPEFAETLPNNFDDEVTRMRARPDIPPMSRPKEPAPAPAQTPPKRAHSKEVVADFSKVPADKEGAKWHQGAKIGVSEPAWTEKSGGMPLYSETAESLPPPNRKLGRWVVIGLVALLGVVGMLIFVVLPDIGKSLVSSLDTMASAPKADRFRKFFDRGQESFLLDSDAAFLQADREYQKVLALDENNSDALAALAQLYGVWAQYLRDAKLDAMSDTAGEPEDASKKEVERLSREFDEKLNEAEGWANRALQANPNANAAFIARADIYRMKGDLDKATTYLKKVPAIQLGPDGEYVSVLLDIEKGKPVETLTSRLAELVSGKPMIRGIYRRARLLASSGEREQAVAALDRLLALNSNHERARDLLSRIKNEKPIWILEKDVETKAEQVAEVPEKETDAAKEEETSKPSEAIAVSPKEHDEADDVKEGRRSVGAMIARAKRLQRRGKQREARALFESVIEDSPTNLEAHSGLGYYYLDTKSAGQAIASFRRCLTLNPNYGPALIGLAETYKFQGQTNQALKYYRRYMETSPNGSQTALAKRNISVLEPSPTPAAEPTPPAPSKPETPLLDSPQGGEEKNEEAEAPSKTPSETKKNEVIIINRDESEKAETE
jgi:predicted Zn finger-like uncharacterized protein